MHVTSLIDIANGTELVRPGSQAGPWPGLRQPFAYLDYGKRWSN